MKKIYSLLLLAGLFLLGAQNVKADIIYPAGTVITFDATAYGEGMNIYLAGIATSSPAGEGNWYSSTSSVITFTLTSDFNASTWGNLFKSGGSGWSDVPMVVPASTAYTIIRVNAQGNGFTWEMPTIPVVGLEVAPYAIQNEEVTLTADAENFSGDVTYAYSYSTDGENFTPIATTASATQAFTVSGIGGTVYTFKVVASYSTEEASTTRTCKILSACTVAGTENFFGSDWDATDSNNDMNASEGVFTWTKSQYLTSPIVISFKVALNHAWDTSYPASNVDKTLNAGYHNVTISFNWSTKEVTFEDVNYPKVEVAGDFNEWTLEELAYNPSGYVYKNIPVTAGSQAFKLKINDAWQGNSGTMTRINCENWTFAEDADCHLLADVDGNYTFYYQNDLVSVSYPTTFTRVVNNTNYQTLCVPFDAVKPEGVAIYEVTNVTESSVTIGTPDIAYLEAGHSYIIKPEAVADIIINMKAEGTEVAAPVNTHMFGILGEDFQPTAALGAYILSNNEFHLVAADGVATVSSTRAYVKVTDPNAAPALRIVEAGNEATDFQNIEGNETAVKFIENGKVLILREGVVYDMTGRVVR